MSAALLLIDVINALDFPGSEALAERSVPMAKRIAALKARARAAGMPTIYVNDNFGRWRSDFRATVASCLEHDVPGRPMVEILAPDADDYFVLKPKHSAFYATVLELLLDSLSARTLVMTGVAGNMCVLFSAHDAYMRDYDIVVPSDCIASNTDDDNRHALEQMEHVLKAVVRPSDEIDLRALTHPND